MNKHETNKMNSFFSMEEVLLGNEAIWETDENVPNAFSILQLKLPLIKQITYMDDLIAIVVKISDLAVSPAVPKQIRFWK